MSYKFTNYQRDAFVRAVLQDTPQIDYDTLLRKRVQEIFVERSDKKLQAIYKDEKLRPFLKSDWVNFSLATYFSCKVYLAEEEFHFRNFSKEHQAELNDLLTKYKDQKTERSELEQKLRGVIYSYTSIKKAHECMPEFTKYLPTYSKDQPSKFHAPAINDLVTDLVKAGWPDKKEKKNASK